MKNVRIRMAAQTDAPALLDIYAPYVTGTVVTYETQTPPVEEFAGRIAKTLETYPYLVAEYEGRAVGFAYAGAFKTRRAYDWTAETSIYVSLEFKGRGIGSALYSTLEALLREQNIVNLVAVITYPNPESIGFHQRHGYQKAAHFKNCGYKLGKWRDTIWMNKALGDYEPQPSPIKPVTALDLKKYFT